MRYGVLFLFISLLIVPFTSYGDSESLHLKCSWVDDKILRDNGSVLSKSPLPDIDFQFPKLRKDQRVKVKLPDFIRVDRPETFFLITELSGEKILVQECLEPNPIFQTEEEYTRLMEKLGKKVDYPNYLKTRSMCKKTDFKGFNINRFTGELEIQHWFSGGSSGFFFHTETSKETYLWYQCEKVDRKF